MRLKYKDLVISSIALGCFPLYLVFTLGRCRNPSEECRTIPFNIRQTINQHFSLAHAYRCPKYNGTKHNNTEDVLCMKKPRFLRNYKNPCWISTGDKLRCLPYFHIIGICKSGTSDLYKRMLMHPQIVPNEGVYNKETWFWSWKRYGGTTDDGRHHTLSDFTEFFNLPKKMKYSMVHHHLYTDLITGHGDPMDIWFPFDWREIPQNNPDLSEPTYITPHLIQHINPNIRLILMIRDPVDRLYSHYIQQKKYEGKTAPPEMFHDHVKSSIGTFEKCQRQNTTRACAYDFDTFQKMQVTLASGLYSVFLKDWLDVFGRGRIFIIRTEAYSHNIVSTLVKLFAFLELDDVDLRTLRTISCQERVHKTDYSHISGQMLSQTRDILKTFYSRSQHDLHTLLRQYNLDRSVIPLNISLNMMNCSSYEDVDPPWKPCNNNMNINSRPKGHNFKQYFVHKGNGTKVISIKKT